MSPSSTCRCSAIRAASSGWERPEKTISLFCGPRSIQWLGFESACVGVTSRPGRDSSDVGVPTDIPLLVLLAGTRNTERAGRDVLGYHRSGRDPCVVANLHRCHERILDTGPDVLADRRPALGQPRPVREVDGDVAGGDVGALVDVGVADVREVRHLRPGADARVLDLHEGARLGFRVEDGAGAKVTERADDHPLTDLRVDRNRMRADFGPGADARAAAEHGEW